MIKSYLRLSQTSKKSTNDDFDDPIGDSIFSAVCQIRLTRHPVGLIQRDFIKKSTISDDGTQDALALFATRDSRFESIE